MYTPLVLSVIVPVQLKDVGQAVAQVTFDNVILRQVMLGHDSHMT